MLQQLRLFLAAIQFFTRIPVPAWVGHSLQQLDQSLRYFPLLGMGVGALAAIVLWLCTLVLPVEVAVVLSMLATVWITGAFHEDGLSDFADGIGGGYGREKILAIMKDSHIGAYGVIAIVFALLLKYQMLLTLTAKHSFVFVAVTMVAAHCISRLMAVSLMQTQSYVRADQSARAKPAVQKLNRNSVFIAVVTGMAAMVLLFIVGASIVNITAALACTLLFRLYLGRQLYKKLGGYTGDCLGAMQQITEIGFYLGLSFSWLP